MTPSPRNALGGKAFVKRRPDPPDGFYAVEAAGLAWLADVPQGADVARVLDVSPDALTVELVEETAPSIGAAVALGHGLARTHAAGAAAYGSPPAGWDGDGFIGPLPITHRPCAGFAEFFALLRLLPFVRQLRDAGTIEPGEVAVLERVCDRVARGVIGGPDEPPSRVHGDLWSGNVVWAEGRAVLVDPSAHGGHRESDLAMLALFGLPYLEPLLSAYSEVDPLADGWRERVGLHQLYPLLVHGVLFGRGYAQRALTIAAGYC